MSLFSRATRQVPLGDPLAPVPQQRLVERELQAGPQARVDVREPGVGRRPAVLPVDGEGTARRNRLLEFDIRGDRLVLGDQGAVELRGRGPAVAVDAGVDPEHRVVDAVRLVDLEQRLGALVALDQQSEVVLQGDRDRPVQFQPELPVGDVQIRWDRLGDPGRTDLHLPRCRGAPDGGRDEDGAESEDRRRGLAGRSAFGNRFIGLCSFLRRRPDRNGHGASCLSSLTREARGCFNNPTPASCRSAGLARRAGKPKRWRDEGRRVSRRRLSTACQSSIRSRAIPRASSSVPAR